MVIGVVLIIFLMVYRTIQNSNIDKKRAVTVSSITKDNRLKESPTSSPVNIEENVLSQPIISGEWVWENSEASTFTIKINKVSNYYIGTYFAVAESGMKIDGDVDDTPSFKFDKLNKMEAIVTFKAYFSETTGKAKLKYENDKLLWEIIEEPNGEYYCPNYAVLNRYID